MIELIQTYLIVSLIVYFFPFLLSIITRNRTAAVFVMNLFLGWTFIGWILALIWSISPNRNQQSIIVNNLVETDRNIPDNNSKPNRNNQQITDNLSLGLKKEQIEEASLKLHQEKIKKLTQLKILLDKGVLTQEEFDLQKIEIL